MCPSIFLNLGDKVLDKSILLQYHLNNQYNFKNYKQNQNIELCLKWWECSTGNGGGGGWG